MSHPRTSTGKRSPAPPSLPRQSNCCAFFALGKGTVGEGRSAASPSPLPHRRLEGLRHREPQGSHHCRKPAGRAGRRQSCGGGWSFRSYSVTRLKVRGKEKSHWERQNAHLGPLLLHASPGASGLSPSRTPSVSLSGRLLRARLTNPLLTASLLGVCEYTMGYKEQLPTAPLPPAGSSLLGLTSPGPCQPLRATREPLLPGTPHPGSGTTRSLHPRRSGKAP